MEFMSFTHCFYLIIIVFSHCVALQSSAREVKGNKIESRCLEDRSSNENDPGTPPPYLVKSQRKLTPATFHWQSSIVPYVVSSDYDSIIEDRIEAAMNNIMRDSCVVFQHMDNWPPPGQSSPITYLSIQNPDGVRECTHSSMREESYSKAVLVIGYDCMRYSEILHALMHALGFSDEVTHPQRDQYIRVMWANIQPKYQTLFWKQTQAPPHKIVEYDPMSVMHFHDRAFSVNGAATILPVVPGLQISPSSRLSQIDVMKLQVAFGKDCSNRKLGKLLLTCQAALNDDESQDSHTEDSHTEDSHTEDSHEEESDPSSKHSSSEDDFYEEVVNAKRRLLL